MSAMLSCHVNPRRLSLSAFRRGVGLDTDRGIEQWAFGPGAPQRVLSQAG